MNDSYCFDNFATLAYGNWRDLPIFQMFYLYKKSISRKKNTEIPIVDGNFCIFFFSKLAIEKFRFHVLSSSTVTVVICPAAARQSEIFTEFPLKDSFNLLDCIWCFLRNVERFQKFCWFARWRNIRAWASLTSAVRDIYQIATNSFFQI